MPIRRACPQDLARLTEIYNEAIAEGGFTGDLDPFSVEARRAWFDDYAEPYAIFVREAAGGIEGYVTLSPYRKGRRAFAASCEISYYVAAAHRGAGAGRALVAHALEAARARGFRTVIAILLGCNARSVGLLARFGFVECGRIPAAATLAGEDVDHVFMSRPA